MRAGWTAALVGLALTACAEPPAEAPAVAGRPARGFAGFEDATEASGVSFTHENGATEHRYLPETMGAGVAVFDYDGDGRPDLFFVGGAAVGAAPPPSPGVLYRNLGGGRFLDVTSTAGLSPGLLGMGVATADVDRDDDLDLVVTGVGGDFLYRNLGDGTFSRGETLPAPSGFGSSAAFVDLDVDGSPDLFLGRYVEWAPATDVPCRSPVGERVYCTPESYAPVASRLLRNRGDGRFEDVTEASGLGALPGKALGVLPLDADRDGRPDLAVANDTAPNQLLVQREPLRFVDEGVERGFAFGPSGAPRGGMGIDGGDFDGDGTTDLVVGNFALESSALFAAREGQFRDVASEVGLGISSLATLAFGTLADDLDGDGWPDLLLVNGHIEPRIAETYPSQSYRQLPLLLLSHNGPGPLEAASENGGLSTALVGRGAASGDLDGDGAPDLVMTENGGSARLYHNLADGRRWLTVRPRGSTYGLEVEVELPEGATGSRTLRRRLVSGRSYLSSPEPVLRFGMGGSDPTMLTLRWPDGRVVQYDALAAGNVVVE